MKKIFVILVGSILVLTVLTANETVAIEIPNNQVDAYDESAILEEAKKQYNANVVYNLLLDKFGDEIPDSFAGAYIDESAFLVIQIAEKYSKEGNSIVAYLESLDFNELSAQDPEFTVKKTDEIIRIAYVKYSQNELTKLKREVSAFLQETCPVYSRSVNARTNQVHVEVKELNSDLKQKIDEFMDLNGYSRDMLCVSQGNEILAESNHIGGQGYYNNNSTLGFTGYYNETKAYISCGHAFNSASLGDSAVYNGNTVGQLAGKRYHNNMAGDWSIVTLNSSQTISGLIKQNASGTMTGKIKGKVNLVAEGTTVYTFGHATKVWSSYKVIDNDVDITYSGGKTILELVSASLKTGTGSTNGDSGAPWVVPYGDNWKAVGIHSGSSTYRYFSPMKHIPTTFSLCIAN